MPEPKYVLSHLAAAIDTVLGKIIGVVDGVVSASKALIVDATKKLDELNIGTSAIDTLTVQNLSAEKLDGIINTVVANIGRSQVISDVESPQVALEVFGEIFCNDLLLGGPEYFGISGHVYLNRINIAGVISHVLDLLGVTGAIEPDPGTESVFSLTDLGNYLPHHVLVLAGLGVTVTTADAWEDIASATGYSTAIWATLNQNKVVGLQPSVVRRIGNLGGNLALFDLENPTGAKSAGIVTTDMGDGVYSVSVTVAYAERTWKYTLKPNTTYAYAFNVDEKLDNTLYFIVGLTAAGSSLVNNPMSVAGPEFGTFTTNSSGVVYIGHKGGAGAGSVKISNLQLNQGATALPYSKPVSNPVKFSLRGLNHSPASDYDGVDEVVFTAQEAGSYTLIADTTGVWATGATFVSTVDIAAGAKYTWSGLGAAILLHMVVEGGVTQQQIRDHGFEAYDPIYLFDGDRIYQDGEKTMLQRVWAMIAGFKFEDPEIDPTELVTNGQDWTGAIGATPPTGWTAYIAGLWSIIDDGGNHTTALKLEDNGTDRSPYISSAIAVIINQKHRVFADYKCVTGTEIRVRIGSTIGGAEYGNVVMGGTSATWSENKYIDFIPTTAIAYIKVRIITTAGGQYGYVDNIRMVAFNIQESSIEPPEDITPYVIDGSLNQAVTKGQNHINVDARAIVQVTHKTGLDALAESQRSLAITKAEKSDLWKNNEIHVILPAMVNGDDILISYSIYPGIPNWIENAKKISESNSLNLTIKVYDNLAVLSATGVVADNAQISFVVAEGNPTVSIDLSA